MNSTEALKEIYAQRKKQRFMLGDLASDYFNSLSMQGHRALAELDKLLLQVEDVIVYSEMALESYSKRFVNEALARSLKFHKEMEDSLDSITDDLNESQTRRIKATWEYKAQELVDLVANEISGSSTKSRTLGYRMPSGRVIRKPTDLALQELRNLAK